MPQAVTTATTHAHFVSETVKAVNDTKDQISTAQTKLKSLTRGATSETIQEVSAALTEAFKSVETASTNATKADKTNVSLTLSVEEPTTKKKIDQDWVNHTEIVFASVVLFTSGVVICLDWWASNNPDAWHSPSWTAFVLIVVIDVFLVGLLNSVVALGSTGKEKWIYAPDRGPAIFILGFLYFAHAGVCPH